MLVLLSILSSCKEPVVGSVKLVTLQVPPRFNFWRVLTADKLTIKEDYVSDFSTVLYIFKSFRLGMLLNVSLHP
jgi:hypothetical protein